MHKFLLLGALLSTSLFVAEVNAADYYYSSGCANGQCGVSNYQYSNGSYPAGSYTTRSYSSGCANGQCGVSSGTVYRSTSSNNYSTSYTTPKSSTTSNNSTSSNRSASRRGFLGRFR